MYNQQCTLCTRRVYVYKAISCDYGLYIILDIHNLIAAQAQTNLFQLLLVANI